MSDGREYTIDERVHVRDTDKEGTVMRVMHSSRGRRYAVTLDDGTTLDFVSGDELLPAWPYEDADRDHPLAARRVPVVNTTHPRWRYEVALVIGDELYGGADPTPDEVELVVSYIEYRQDYYTSSWQAKHRKWPLDTDSGTKTVILMKYPHGGWGFRRASWERGPLLVPARQDEPQALASVLDRINSIGGELYETWARWKTHHPEVFGQNQETRPMAALPPEFKSREPASLTPIEILGVDDWLVFGVTADGALVFTIVETLPAWLDAPNRGQADYGTDAHAADWRCILARLAEHPGDYDWQVATDPDTGAPESTDDYRGRLKTYGWNQEG